MWNVYVAIRIIKISLMKSLKKDLLIHTDFLIMKSLSLFCCCEKVFTRKDIWMIGKNSDYIYAKRVCKDFEIKNLSEYHDLYVQSDTLLADYLTTFRICVLKYMGLTLLFFLSAQRFTLLATLKNNKVNLHLLTDIDILLVVWKGIRGGICHNIHWDERANNKHMKDYEKIKNLGILSTGM